MTLALDATPDAARTEQTPAARVCPALAGVLAGRPSEQTECPWTHTPDCTSPETCPYC